MSQRDAANDRLIQTDPNALLEALVAGDGGHDGELAALAEALAGLDDAAALTPDMLSALAEVVAFLAGCEASAHD